MDLASMVLHRSSFCIHSVHFWVYVKTVPASRIRTVLLHTSTVVDEGYVYFVPVCNPRFQSLGITFYIHKHFNFHMQERMVALFLLYIWVILTNTMSILY